MKPWIKLIVSIALPLLAGALASTFTFPGVDTWYTGLRKPAWRPPDAVFGPVWTVLYLLMGIALYLVWRKEVPARRKAPALALFGLQLVLNMLWSWLFFSRYQIGWALAEIIVLWLAILLTIFAFARHSRPAAWLLVPYISWVSFAALLNFSIWQLNPAG